MKKRSLLIYVFLLIGCVTLRAQSVTVDNFSADDILQREQLKGNSDNRSFIIRPVNLLNHRDDSVSGMVKSSAGTFHFLKVQGRFTALPLDWVQAYNSNRPYGWNDGAMIPAKGYQSLVSLGFYAKWGIFSLQLKPELVYAMNQNFHGFAAGSDTLWAYYYSLLNRIDNPEQMGQGSYKKAFPGQSNFLMNFKSVSIGISTENIWWGPGFRNAIMMTNSAPGFAHLTLHTNKPIKTGIGSFEFQFISGKLVSSGVLPPDTGRTFYGTIHTIEGGPSDFYNNTALYEPKINDWRYLNAVVITWQPKWVHGLYIGIDRGVYSYSTQLQGSFFNKYLPAISVLSFVKNFNAQVTSAPSDELLSLFGKWVMPKAHAEIYAEWGRNDNSANFRDFLLDPGHEQALIFGFRKLVLIAPQKSLDIQFETTQLGYSNSYLVSRAQEGWYAHYQVRDGYTNYGQMVGAGIGTGGESETLNISLQKKNLRLGMMLERYVHNNDFYKLVTLYTNFKGDPWTDYAVTGHIMVPYKNLDFNAELSVINSSNYEWANLSSTQTISPSNLLNLSGKIALRYYF